ncbi:MAG TPA: hypothetical protein PKD59_17095 [Miltoncostaeaceae bacterium]|nr:hypothetical protein [Miltoncostaeaceae bacterium]
MRRIRPAIALALVAALLGAALLAGCGPLGPTDPGGDQADPVKLLAVLPSPGELRGPDAQQADAADLAAAFTGVADPALASIIDSRDPKAAAVRSWTGPGGQTLTAVATVWDSHLVATQVGADLAQRLVSDGGRGWTPPEARAARGARRDDPRELRLARSVGPNAVYLRATGPVPDETVTTALERLTQQLQENPEFGGG